MTLQHFIDKSAGHDTVVFSRLPLDAAHDAEAAATGVSCAVCHQAETAGLGTPDSYDGNLTIAPVSQHPRPLYGPYAAEPRFPPSMRRRPSVASARQGVCALKWLYWMNVA